MRRWTHPIMFLAIAVPNLLAILYSYQHNSTLIISKLPPAAQENFERITRIDYTVAFLIGAVGTVSMVIYLTMVAGGLRRGGSTAAPSSPGRAGTPCCSASGVHCSASGCGSSAASSCRSRWR